MKLIDADGLMEDLTYTIETMIEEYEDDDFGVHNEHDVKYLKGNINFSEIAKRLIEKQRTAFDVDKVVEQLEEVSNISKTEPTDLGIVDEYKWIFFNDAIEIVKAGGIDD
jgi:predicted CopG family antitoxin